MYDYENYKFRHVTGARVYDAIGKTYMKSKARPGPLPLLRIGSHELQQIEARHELPTERNQVRSGLHITIFNEISFDRNETCIKQNVIFFNEKQTTLNTINVTFLFYAF